MKVVERVIETIIRQMVDIDEMQFGFMPGIGTTDAIFILRQVQEKFLSKDKLFYFAFVDLVRTLVSFRGVCVGKELVAIPSFVKVANTGHTRNAVESPVGLLMTQTSDVSVVRELHVQLMRDPVLKYTLVVNRLRWLKASAILVTL